MEWETAPESPFGAPLPKVEPEEDPLGGDVSPTQEGVTVPSEVVAVPPVRTPRGVQLVNLNDLLRKPSRILRSTSSNDLETESNPLQSLTASISGRQVQNAPVSAIVQPQTINIRTSTARARKTASNRPVSPEPEEMLVIDLEENSIEDELSELLVIKKPVRDVQPVSLPSSRLVRRMNHASPQTAINCRKIMPMGKVPISPKKNHPVSRSVTPLIPSSVLPGSNMMVVLTSDGQYVVQPVTSTSAPSSSDGGKRTVISVNNPRYSSCSLPVSGTVSDEKGKSQTSKSSMVTALNDQAANLSDAPSILGKRAVPLLGKGNGQLGIVPPGTSSSSVPQPKLTWPPPESTKRRKQKPSLPLSGSWTNPNPQLVTSGGMELARPEKDPLDGPVQAISYNGETPLLQPRCVKFTRATQCCLFPEGASIREAVTRTDPAGLKRVTMVPTVRGIGMGVQSKMILYNVFKYFEQRKAYYNLCYAVPEVAQNATGVRISTLRKIMREAKQTCSTDDPGSMPTFKAPIKNRTRAKVVVSNIHIDSALRRYIHEYLLKKKESPGTKYLFRRCLADGFKKARRVGSNFIRLRVKKLGFVSLRTTRRRTTVEGAPIRAWRYEYLKQMKTCVEQKKNIVFTFVVKLRELKHSATEWVVLEGDDEIKERCRVLTVFHAAGEKGFIDGGFFMNDTPVDPVKSEKAKCYYEWLERHVLKKIPEGSAVVLAHDKYHETVDKELKPNVGSSKKELVDWLKSHVVGDIDETLPKCVLIEKASSFPVEQKYTIDSLVETYGHTAVHLPPSHRDLNPIEYVWEDIRTKFYNRGKLKMVEKCLADEFSSAESKLQEAFKQVQQNADTYRKYDLRLDVAQEAAVRKLGGIWNCPSNSTLPDDTGEQPGAALNGGNANSSDSDSSVPSSNSGSDSDTESDDDDDGGGGGGDDDDDGGDDDDDDDDDDDGGGDDDDDDDDDDGDDSEESEPSNSSSSDEEDDVTLAERMNGSKRQKT